MINAKDLPYSVTDSPHVQIPMRDGVNLAARIWAPDGSDRFPAIVEINPYRKSDGMVELDELSFPYMAGNGFACVRVDTRGTGDSEGACNDEYTKE